MPRPRTAKRAKHFTGLLCLTSSLGDNPANIAALRASEMACAQTLADLEASPADPYVRDAPYCDKLLLLFGKQAPLSWGCHEHGTLRQQASATRTRTGHRLRASYPGSRSFPRR